MVTFLMFFLLVAILYEFIIYNHYQEKTVAKSEKETTNISSPAPQSEDADIIGKSTFNMKAEMERRRKVKEEAERKVAVARGEMTEDGKEIAQEVAMEDCEVETKREWKQVPTEELDAMFDEPDSGEPQAEGVIIDDIDLAFHTVRKKEPTKEEVRKAAETLIQLEGTEFKDEICRLFPEVKNDIDRVMKMYSSELNRNTKEPEPKKVNKKQEKKPFPERFEDFTVEDFV